jgi:hypothetical protein
MTQCHSRLMLFFVLQMEFTVCDVCWKYREEGLKEIDPKKREEIKDKLTQHINHFKRERRAYYTKRDQAITNPKRYLSIIIDGADQAKHKFPHFAQKVSIFFVCLCFGWLARTGTGVHQRGFWIFLLSQQTKNDATAGRPQMHVTGVIAHGRGTWAFVSGEEWPHDSNLTIECFQRVLHDLEAEGPLPPFLFVQMDNCSR